MAAWHQDSEVHVCSGCGASCTGVRYPAHHVSSGPHWTMKRKKTIQNSWPHSATTAQQGSTTGRPSTCSLLLHQTRRHTHRSGPHGSQHPPYVPTTAAPHTASSVQMDSMNRYWNLLWKVLRWGRGEGQGKGLGVARQRARGGKGQGGAAPPDHGYGCPNQRLTTRCSDKPAGMGRNAITLPPTQGASPPGGAAPLCDLVPRQCAPLLSCFAPSRFP